MAYFVFVGDPSDNGGGARSIELMGSVFNRTEPTFVGDESILCQKLRGNNHFKEVTPAEKRERKRTDQPAEIASQTAQEEE